jgi:hypothetical protein
MCGAGKGTPRLTIRTAEPGRVNDARAFCWFCSYHLFRDYRELDKRDWGFVVDEFCADIDEIHERLGGTQVDSSCLIINKVVGWDALLATVAMNGPLQPYTYNRLNGDKDTWVMAASITYLNFTTGRTTPGYFMVGADPALAAIDANYQGKAEMLRGHVQFLKAGTADADPGGVTPLYLNNQVLNFTEYPAMKHRLFFGLWEDYGYPFCGWKLANPQLRLQPKVLAVLDTVATALAEIGAEKECLCKQFRCRYPYPFEPDWPYWIFRR